MKVALTTVLIIGFALVAVFGVFAMGHCSGHCYGGCIAATANRQLCPENENALQFLTFHFDSFKSFSTAIFGDNFAIALFWFLALLMPIGVRIMASAKPTPTIFATSYRHKQSLELLSHPLQRELAHWLSLHENSPAVL